MKLIDRYLLREYLVATVYCLVAFALLHVIIDLFMRLSQFLEAGVSGWRIVAFYGWSLVAINGPTSFFTLILPISMLLGLLYSLHMLSRNNELTAMRACGIGLFRLMAPYFGVGLVAALLCLWIQERVAPGASIRVKAMEQVLRGGADGGAPLLGHPFMHRPAQRQWRIGRLDPQSPHVLHDVRIITEGENRRSEWEAARAEWLDGAWWLFEASYREYDEHERPLAAPSTPSPLPVEQRGFDETPGDILLAMRSWELFSSLEMARFMRHNPELSNEGRARQRVRLHIRLAMPWVCLVVTLLGIPGGVHTQRQGALVGILSAIFFLFVFYSLVQAGSYLGQRQLVPAWIGAWFPNVSFIVAGLHMLRHMR